MYKSPSLSVMYILMPAAQDLLYVIRIPKGRDQFHGPPSQLKRRLGLPGATRESPLFPHHNLRETPHFTPQLEKNHEISPSSRDEALLLMQGLETNPDFLSKLQRRFDSL